MTTKQLNDLRQIPGVGKAIAQHLADAGINSIQDLKGQIPETLYQQLCTHQGKQVDRCMLYVLRCAVYYASTDSHEPELLKWWNWKDREATR